MNNKYDHLINEFEGNVRNLITENDELKKENRELLGKLEEKDQELMNAHKKLLDTNAEYDNLLSANVLNGSEEGRRQFKQFLQEMVDEIDKSISLIK